MEVCRFSVVIERKFVFKIRSKFGKPWHFHDVVHDSCTVNWISPVFRQSCYPVHAAVIIIVNTFWWKFGTAEIAGT